MMFGFYWSSILSTCAHHFVRQSYILVVTFFFKKALAVLRGPLAYPNGLSRSTYRDILDGGSARRSSNILRVNYSLMSSFGSLSIRRTQTFTHTTWVFKIVIWKVHMRSCGPLRQIARHKSGLTYKRDLNKCGFVSTNDATCLKLWQNSVIIKSKSFVLPCHIKS
jgi:hypothetical protein